jgi:Glucose / Sorbosone dehydrogenase
MVPRCRSSASVPALAARMPAAHRFAAYLLGACVLMAGLALSSRGAYAETTPRPTRGDIQVRKVLSTTAASVPTRLARDPRGGALYLLRLNGNIFRINVSAGTLTLAYGAAAHGLHNGQGFAIGPDGTMYVVGNADVTGMRTQATIAKGIPQPGAGRTWSILARTEPYPKSNTPYDHRANGIAIGPNGAQLFVNSGSRTDHGEVQSAGGLYPGLREVGLTGCILRLPTSGSNILLRNDRAWLKSNGYIYAEGTRNSFDLAFAPNGDLFGTENGPTSDASDELNWLRPGRHYGYPWRLGGGNNPQQFPGYNPANDKMLNPIFNAVRDGFWHNDPNFPPKPAIAMIEPILSRGPHADSFRDPVTGAIRDVSALGRGVRTFTAHRSPLGLVFDRTGALAPELRGDGFVLGWTTGDPAGDSVPGPFNDPGQDLLHLDLAKASGVYTLRATRMVGGFNNPVDAEIVGNVIYVLDYGGTQALWEVTLPQ